MFGEVIINNEDVFALMHEVFSDGYTRVWCEVLHRGTFGCAGMNDDGVIHSAGLFQFFIYTDNVGVFLSDGYVNADNVLTLLVQDGIDADSRLTSTTVADDQFALAAANRNHGVNGFQTCLQRYINWLSVSNARCFDFNVAIFVGFDRSLSVDWLSERVYYASDNCIAYRNLHQVTCSLNNVAFLNGFGATQKNGTYVAFFQVECHAVYAVRKFEQFAGHAILKAVHMGNAIADFKNRTYFIDIEVYFVVFNLFFNDRCNFI